VSEEQELAPYTRTQEARRVRWELGREVSVNLRSLEVVKCVYDAWLQDHGLPFRIDEVAVMVRNKEEAGSVVMEAVKVPGVSLFNHASDQVRTEPFSTEYRVTYNFLGTDMGFRVELMHADRSKGENATHTGFSPLHDAAWGRCGARGPIDAGLPIVHASFKCVDLAAYDEAVSAISKAAQHGMTCCSTYGVFSYWLPYDSDALVYLKPRVNLRDMA